MYNGELFYVKNFLPENLHKEIFNLVNNETKFPWYFLSCTSGNNINGINDFGFAHLLYSYEDEHMSGYFSFFKIFEEYIKKYFSIEIEKTLRYRLGLNPKISDKRIFHSPHKDYDFDHLVLLYYINNSDGPTCFYDNKGNIIKEFLPIANSALLFNGNLLHGSSSPIFHEKRIVLNINFIAKNGGQ